MGRPASRSGYRAVQHTCSYPIMRLATWAVISPVGLIQNTSINETPMGNRSDLITCVCMEIPSRLQQVITFFIKSVISGTLHVPFSFLCISFSKGGSTLHLRDMIPSSGMLKTAIWPELPGLRSEHRARGVIVGRQLAQAAVFILPFVVCSPEYS